MRLLLYSALILFATESAPLEFKTQAQFDLEIDKSLIASRTKVAVREFLDQLSKDHKIAIILDRRIDPSSEVQIKVNERFLDVGIEKVVEPLNAGVVVIADTVLVLPNKTAGELRSHLAFADEELDVICRNDRQRQLTLSKRSTVQWEMLTTPQEILSDIANHYKLRISNLEAIPHDLWPAGTIASPEATEAFLAVLIQFDLSFKWVDASTIAIIPLPPAPLIEQLHRPRGISVVNAMEAIAKRYPNIKVEKRGTRINVTAQVEVHEELSVLLGERKPRRTPASDPKQIPLDQRTFTLKMVRQPFLALVNSLKQQGIQVEYDANKLEAAGVDLTQKISLELKQASLNELLDKACGEVNVSHRTEGLTVYLELP